MAGVKRYTLDLQVLDECFHEAWKASGFAASDLMKNIGERPLGREAYATWNDHHW